MFECESEFSVSEVSECSGLNVTTVTEMKTENHRTKLNIGAFSAGKEVEKMVELDIGKCRVSPTVAHFKQKLVRLLNNFIGLEFQTNVT